MAKNFNPDSFKIEKIKDSDLFQEFREEIVKDLENGFSAISTDLADLYDQVGEIEIPEIISAENQNISFTAATNKENIATGETVKTLFGKIAKWFDSFGDLAWKSKIAAGDIDNIGTFKQGLNYTPEDVGAMPAITSMSGTYSELKLVNNTEYDYDNISSLEIELGDVSAHGFVKFGTISSAPKYINSEDVLKTYRFDGDDITTAANNELWEFDILNKSMIWMNWGVLSE